MPGRVFAQVIIPLPLEGAFTYIVPPHLADQVKAGSRVLVPFGKRHFYTGIVENVTSIAPQVEVALKEIASVLDPEPIVRRPQIRFWHWMAQYYLCTIGDVYKAALPSGLKLESETRVKINPDALPEDFENLNDKALEVLEIIRQANSITIDGINRKLKENHAERTVGSLIEKSLLTVEERVVERYRAVKRPYVRPTINRSDPEALQRAFEAVKRARKQEDALVALIALSEFNKKGAPVVEVPLEVLLERAATTRSIVNALVDKGLCEIYNKEISRFSYTGPVASDLPRLTETQEKALGETHRQFKEKDIVLLHGVTGSGKTEVYMHLIDFVLRQGRQVLFLVPEIALTTQLTHRLQKVFGEKVLIYHSKFSDNERVELWNRLLKSREPRVIIGARSAVFLPFADLGLVIVDEEHETSYKQNDPAPRYNGRDSASVLATMHGAKTLFGSATPTVETYYKARSGKFGLVTMDERYGGISLPQIEILDMRQERSRKAVTGYFSRKLLESTSRALGEGRQAIFFHNRRGYSPIARCRMCAYTPRCSYCDVTLTYHRGSNRLQCHYCGSEYSVPQICPECREPAIETKGYGTERLEEEIAENFGNSRVLRMDLDTTRNKESYGKIIDEFSHHKADILVGTQMVTKGLDFSDVDVVGILNADSLINYPDFRANERAFNMIEQVAGRAGRRSGKGNVVIQTYTPEHPILAYARNHDYEGYYEHELDERRAFSFPPFSRIINIYLKHRDKDTVEQRAIQYADSLRTHLVGRVFGPQEPPVARVQSLYIRKIMLKIEAGISLNRIKELLRSEYVKLVSGPSSSALTVYYDVDPV